MQKKIFKLRLETRCSKNKTNKFDYLKRENFYMAEYISKSKDKQYTRRKYL